MENNECQSTPEQQPQSTETDGTLCNGPAGEPKPLDASGELCAIQMSIIKFDCPQCKAEALIPGPPFGPVERIAMFAQGRSLRVKCGKCGAMLELSQKLVSSIATMPPRNRHEKRAAAAGVRPVLVK